MYLDDKVSSTWKQFATEYMPAPPAVGSFTAVGNISLVQFADAIRAMVTSDVATHNAGAGLVAQSLPVGTPWTITLVATWIGLVNTSFPEIGCVVTNGTTSGTSTGHGIFLNLNNQSAPSLAVFFVEGFTVGVGGSTGTEVNSVPTNQYALTGTGRLHLALINDGVNLHGQLSSDGFQWQDWVTEATPTGMTDYGFVLGTVESTGSHSYGQAVIFECTYSASVTQDSVTAASGSGVAVQITIANTSKYQAGDFIAVHGMLGNTAANTSTGNGAAGGGILIKSVDNSTQMTLNATGNGTYTSGGTITNLSRRI